MFNIILRTYDDRIYEAVQILPNAISLTLLVVKRNWNIVVRRDNLINGCIPVIVSIAIETSCNSNNTLYAGMTTDFKRKLQS